jgi:hypothetical protein
MIVKLTLLWNVTPFCVIRRYKTKMLHALEDSNLHRIKYIAPVFNYISTT